MSSTSIPERSTATKVGMVLSRRQALDASLGVHPLRNVIAVDLIQNYCALEPDNAVPHACARLVSCPDVTVPAVEAMLVRWMCEFHDDEYISFLQTREQRTGPDERHQMAQAQRKRPRSPGPSWATAAATKEGELELDVVVPKVFVDLIPTEGDVEYGLVNDCVPFTGMWCSILSTAAGTKCTCEALLSSRCCSDEGAPALWIGLHWWGGRHHAKRDQADGFCFVNDVVLAALMFRKALQARLPRGRASRVLVVDIDAHHGDGTQEAFNHDPSVYCFSVHRYGVGVYPGTGGVHEVGEGFGLGSTRNVPLPEGCDGQSAVPFILTQLESFWEEAAPGAVIVVCGADALQGDPLGGLNFGVSDLQQVMRVIMVRCLQQAIPLLVLGAGGYVDTSFAKVAAVVTKDALYLSERLERGEAAEFIGNDVPPLLIPLHRIPGSGIAPVSLPDGSKFFSLYGPLFCLNDLPSCKHARVSFCEPVTDREALLRCRLASLVSHRSDTQGGEEEPEESSDSSSLAESYGDGSIW